VLSTAGLAFYLMFLLYLFIDLLGWWGGAPFFYAGDL